LVYNFDDTCILAALVSKRSRCLESKVNSMIALCPVRIWWKPEFGEVRYRLRQCGWVFRTPVRKSCLIINNSAAHLPVVLKFDRLVRHKTLETEPVPVTVSKRGISEAYSLSSAKAPLGRAHCTPIRAGEVCKCICCY